MVQVPLAGDSFGTALNARIVSYNDAQHVTLSVAAERPVAVATVSYMDLAIASPNTGISSITHTFTPDQLG